MRDLLAHSAGFVTDDPCGDRQLDMPDRSFAQLVGAGIPFARMPGLAHEYSNYGYALLGSIVGAAAGTRYQDHVRREVLEPLHSFVHSGGLTGYGSNVLLIPEHDIGIFAFANRTYAPAALVVRQAAARLYDTGAPKAVSKRSSDALLRIEQAVAKIYAARSVTAEPQALAVNLLLDRSAARRDRELQAVRAQLGERRARSEMDVRHALSAVLRY